MWKVVNDQGFYYIFVSFAVYKIWMHIMYIVVLHSQQLHINLWVKSFPFFFVELEIHWYYWHFRKTSAPSMSMSRSVLWSIYPYSSRSLLKWSYHYDCHSASEVTLNDMVKLTGTNLQYKCFWIKIKKIFSFNIIFFLPHMGKIKKSCIVIEILKV